MLLRIKYKLHLILLLLIQSSHLIGQSSGEKTSLVIESTNLVNKTESYNDEKSYNDLISIIFKDDYGVIKNTGVAKFPSDTFSDYPEIAVLFEKNFIFNDTISDYFFIAKNGISDRVVIKFNDALFLLHERGKAMQEAVPVGKGGMIAVLGVKIENIIDLLKSQNKFEGVCEIANDNADGQVIISGNIEKIENLKKFLKEKKIKSIPLKVSAPFHCTLMKPATEIMREKILNTKFKNPQFKIVNNVTASPETNSDIIKELLIKQISSTVRWRESVIKIYKNNTKNFIEIGPGKILTGMVKRTIKNANCFSINSIADIKNLKNEFKK